MHGQNGVERIGLAGEHGARLHRFDEGAERLNVAGQIGLHVLAFVGEFEVGFDIAAAAGEFAVVGKHRLEPFSLAHERLRLRRIRPEIRVGELYFEGREVAAQPGRVKDTPAGFLLFRGPGSRRIRVRST